MERIVNCERADAGNGIGGVVAPAGEHGVHRRVHGLGDGNLAHQTQAGLGEVALARIEQVGANLQVARILGRLAFDDARVGGGNEKFRRTLLRGLHQGLQRGGEFLETDGILHERAGVGLGERGVVGEEIAGLGKIDLGLVIVAAMDGIVGPLEEPVFAILNELERRLDGGSPKTGQSAARDDHGGGDVVLQLNLERGVKILAEAEGAPRAVGAEADAQETGLDALALEAEFVGGRAVDDIDAEVGAPVVAPFRAVEAFHDEDQFLVVRRQIFQPAVVVVGIFRGGRREELDDGTERAFGTQQGPAIRAPAGGIAETLGVVVGQQGGDRVEIGGKIGDEHRAGDDGIVETFGDLGFSAAGDGAGLVTKRALGVRADEAPGAAAAGFFEVNLVARRQHVGVMQAQRLGDRATFMGPADSGAVEFEVRIGRHVDDSGIIPVDRGAVGLQLGAIAQQRECLGEGARIFVGDAGGSEVGREVVAVEEEGAAGVFLLGEAEQVGGVADLRLHLFFAVTEIIVGNHGDDDTAGVATGGLEGAAVVVALGGIAPAHAVTALAGGGVGVGREAEFLFREQREVRGEHDAAGVAAPVFGIERGVVFREARIAGVAEDAFDEVEIADETAGDEETDFHFLLGGKTRDGGADHGPEQQGDHAFRGGRLRRQEGQAFHRGGRLQGMLQELGKNGLGHGLLVVGHGQAVLGDVENALRGAAVAQRIVQHALAHAVGSDDVGPEDVAIRRERERAGQTAAIEDEAHRGQARRIGPEAGIKVVLDALINRAKVIGEQAVLLAAEGDESAGELVKSGLVIERIGRTPEVAQAKIDVEQQQALFFRRGGGAQADLAQLSGRRMTIHNIKRRQVKGYGKHT